MILKFSYTPTVEDFCDFQKFKMKTARVAKMYYIVFAIMIAFGIYILLTSKDASFLIESVIFAVVIFASYFYEKNIKMKRTITKYQKLDSSYLSTNEFVLYHNAIEINSVKEDGKPYIDSIYPFTTMIIAIENEKGFYFILAGGEVRIVPKREISEENIKIISDTLKKIPNYKFVK